MAGVWVSVQEDKGLVSESWFLLTYQRDGQSVFPPIVHGRVRGLKLAKYLVEQLNSGGISPEGEQQQLQASGCTRCGTPYQGKGRFCPLEQKMRDTCENDHCLECGTST